MKRLVILLALTINLTAQAGLKWKSAATGDAIDAQLLAPAHPATSVPVIIYLKNLSVPRRGIEPDQPILDDLLAQGNLVLVLDYAHHAKAASPDLNADVLKLREDIGGKSRTLLADQKVDLNHVFILCEGYRLKRDVEFSRDGSRPLAMDVAYPSHPTKAPPVLMEITCDNQNRMGNASLLFCHDTLLEGAQAAGFATAMVDHPVAPPYKGIDDPMPDCIERMKSAAKTLRELSPELKTSGKIGAIGFSRGGPFAAILAATHDVDAALVHGNRYDYLDLLPTDAMLARFEKAWGPRDTNADHWKSHGASIYVTAHSAPMFLNTSNAESPEYRDGLAKFDRRLTDLGIEHVYQIDPDDRGHRVSTDPQTLAKIYAFFATHL